MYLVWHQYTKRWICRSYSPLGFHVMKAEGWIMRDEVHDSDYLPPTLQELGDAMGIASTFRTYNDERAQHEH